MTHPAEESLIAYASGAADEIAPHVDACDECRTEAESYREMFATGTAAPSDADSEVLGVAARLDREERDAAGLIAALRSTPLAQWGDAIASRSTIGMVRALWREAETRERSNVADALAIAELARDAAERATGYPEALLARTRGHAWREVSYERYCAGDHNGALAAGERAEAALDGVAGAEFDLARIRQTKALALKSLDRGTEASVLITDAARVLLEHGDINRYLGALTLLGTIEFRNQNLEAALEIFVAVRDHPFSRSNPYWIATSECNVGICLAELGRASEAEPALMRAVRQFEEQGAKAPALNAKWGLGRMLLREQAFEAALDRLSDARNGFAEMGKQGEVRWLTVQIIEVLLILGENRTAYEEATRLMTEFAANGLSTTTRARTALALLREAAERDTATPEMISDVRGHLLELVRTTDPSTAFLA